MASISPTCRSTGRKADVLAAANRGWMLGTAADQFAPDAALTRAEAATIIVRALGLTGRGGQQRLVQGCACHPLGVAGYPDREESGLIQGISSERFAPDQIMTREQMSVLLSRALHLTSQRRRGRCEELH